MEHRTLKLEIEIVKDVQEIMNNINCNLDFESNYEALLKLYLAKMDFQSC
jgi:hypothetical protein